MLYFHIFVVILCSHESWILKFLYEFIKFFKRIGIIIFVYAVFFEYFYRGKSLDPMTFGQFFMLITIKRYEFYGSPAFQFTFVVETSWINSIMEF